MKTLILAINAKYIHSALAPWYLKAMVREANAAFLRGEAQFEGTGAAAFSGILEEPEILETNVNRPAEEILAEILAAGPAVLAISCYLWNMPLVEELLREIDRRLPDCILLLGGPEVSFDSAERLRRLPMTDYILCGEGEASFVRLLSLLNLAKKNNDPESVLYGETGLSTVPGLTWRRDGEIVENPIREIRSEPPDPFLPEYGERLAGRMAYLETSRGCPFLCGFCLSGRSDPVRFFDREQVKHNLIKLACSGTKTVKLVDRTFNCYPPRSREMIRFLLDSRRKGDIPEGVCFHFEVAADLFDQQSIDLLREAQPGFFQLEIGLQSFRPAILKLVGRKTDLALAKKNIRLLREKNNIHIHLDLIAGLPGEDYRSFGNSFDQAFSLSPHMLQLGFLKLLHGSRLREESLLYGIEYDPQPPYQVRQTNAIKAEELADLALCEDALDRLYNSGRFPATCAYLLHAVRVPGGEALSPFQLFSAIGRFTGKSFAMPLEAYIARILDFGGALSSVEQNALRNCLVIDWLQTNHVGILPLCLQKADPLLARIGRILERLYNREQHLPELGSRRYYGFALLYKGDTRQIALADYRKPRPVLGNYPLQVLAMDELDKIASIGQIWR